MNAKNSLYPAIFTLIGTTIGAGILALPYTFMQSGFLVGAISLGIVFVITLLLNLFYAEILVHVKEKHQFAGYANTFFGRKGKIIATLGLMIGAYGALLAYTIQIGIFLHTLIPSVGAFHFSIGFYIVSSLLILVSLNWFSMIETLMVSGLLLLMGIIIISGVPHITWSNYAQTSSDLTSLLLPYGVLLFAFSGYSVIPEIGQLTDYDTYKLRKAILGAGIIIGVIYLLFSAIVVGVSGEMTSQDGITGLLNFLNPVVVKIGIIIAVLAIATSFISLGHVLRDLYHEDLSISSSLSWILVIVPPMAIYLMDHVTFVEVLEFSGAVTVGISGLLLGMMYLKVKSKESKNLLVINAPSVLVYASIGVFIAGVMYEIVKGLL